MTAAVLWPLSVATSVVAWNHRESVVMHTLSLASTNAAILHASSLVAMSAVVSRPEFYVCRKYAGRALMGFLAAGGSLAFWFAWFAPAFCSDASGCGALTATFWTYILYVSAGTVMQAVALSLFAYTHLMHRIDNWTQMLDLERRFGFHESLVIGESSANMQRFCTYWINRSSSEIIESLPGLAHAIMCAMVEDMDVNQDRRVSKAEFMAFSSRHCSRHHLPDLVWHTLCDDEENAISAESIQHALYDLAFYRRRLAHLVRTDMLVVDWAMCFLDGICYSACGILATSLWGYSALGGGLDLLKVYLGLLTYVLSSMGPTISFVLSMVLHRPYNLGDVLRLSPEQSLVGASSVGSSLFQVAKISLFYTSLVGTHPIQIQNRSLVNARPIINMSRSPMNDTLFITVPITTNASFVNRVHEAIVKHAYASTYGINKRVTLKVVWNELAPTSKRLEVRWTYLPVVHDHVHAKLMMYHARNVIHQAIWKELREDALVLGAAQGGAFNSSVQML